MTDNPPVSKCNGRDGCEAIHLLQAKRESDKRELDEYIKQTREERSDLRDDIRQLYKDRDAQRLWVIGILVTALISLILQLLKGH